MGIINQLGRQVAELIAAGEVVERPASVVKEMVENAMDAGATAVTVEIKNGGMTFIRVTDNGSGMYREDVPLAFLSHATSKIRREEDLESICTLGFRGEALASIAAVARVEVLTRREEELEGTRLVIESGQESVCEPAGCPKGSTLIVRDLFYNTPARLKFIKKDASEANAVEGVLDKLAVSHPTLSVKLIRDGALKLNTPGDGKLISAVYAVYGKDFAKELTEVDYQANGLSVQGLISKPEAARGNRTMQNFFINGRFVKSRTCGVALEEAYKGAIMVGRFPACILNVVVQPDTVDVNVHPAKIEVRFANEKNIFDLVYFGVKNALQAVAPPELTTRMPKAAETQQRISAKDYRTLAAKEEQAEQTGIFRKIGTERVLSPAKTVRLEQESASAMRLQDSTANMRFFGTSVSEQGLQVDAVLPAELARSLVGCSALQEEPPTPPRKQTAKQAGSTASPRGALQSSAEEEQLPPPEANPAPQTLGGQELFADARMIGEVFSTYILLESANQLWLVDKHAAHERILYEQLRQKQGAQWRQELLVPQTVMLEKGEYEAALEHLEVLADCGFEAEDFGGSLLVRTAPMWLDAGEVSPTVSRLCEDLCANKHDITPAVLDELYHSVACKAAIKGGWQTNELELEALIQVMRAEGNIRHCPHGRPVMVSLSKQEIEKRFGRI